MKRNDCSIVQDLLPLYIEEMLQPDTVAYVEDHLSGCETCTDLLAELKSADPPAPDAEDARTGDQRVLKGLKKTLTARNIFVALTVLYGFSYLFALIAPQRQGISPHTFLLILLVFFPLYLAIAMFLRKDPIPRNTAVAVSCVILPVAGLPLFLFVNAFHMSLYDALYNHKYTGLYPYETLWEWFSATFNPSLFSAILCGILITAHSLRNVWHNAESLQKPSAFFTRLLHVLVFCFSGLIIALHCIPWIFIYPHRSYGISPLDFSYLLYEWIPLCIATAIAFCEVTSRKQAIIFSICSLALPGYLYYYWVSAFGADRIWSWNVPETEWFYPFDESLLLGLYCLLSSTAICSVWYQLKQQTKHAPPAA